jgi:hypothetical protein
VTQRSLFDLMPAPSAPPPATPPVEIAADVPIAPAVTEHCELELLLHYDNEVKGEISVSVSGNVQNAVWLLKAQIQYTPAGRNAPALTTAGNPVPGGMPVILVNLPVWLAKEKGLM